MSASNDLLQTSPYVREGLTLAHRIGKEAYWIRELSRRLFTAVGEESGPRTTAETIHNLAERIFQATRDFTSEIERLKTVEQGQPIAALLAEALESIGQSGTAHPVECELGESAGSLRIDPGLREVIVILVENAIEASPDGSPVFVTIREQDGEVQLDVTDRGLGMCPEVAARCFDAGFTTKAESGGKGLGLAIARAAVRAAGGEIEMESGTEGTRVRVRVPGV